MAQEDFQAIVRAAARRQLVDWDEAVALLHMVYAWMPTMLRTIKPHSPTQRRQLLAYLQRVKAGELLNSTELSEVQRFANGSIVGASKLLHVLNPSNYAIWDSRVAGAFLWKGVAPAAYSTIARYEDYLNALRQWANHPSVSSECAKLRRLNHALASSGNLRLIELVLFYRL